MLGNSLFPNSLSIVSHVACCRCRNRHCGVVTEKFPTPKIAACTLSLLVNPPLGLCRSAAPLLQVVTTSQAHSRFTAICQNKMQPGDSRSLYINELSANSIDDFKRTALARTSRHWRKVNYTALYCGVDCITRPMPNPLVLISNM